MDDQEYFKQYQHFFAGVFSGDKGERVFLKDAEFRYQFMSDNMLKLLGVASLTEVLDLTAVELAPKIGWVNADIAQTFSQQDQKLKKNQIAATFLEILPHAPGPSIFVVYKVPLFNPASGNFVGMRGQVVNMIWPHAVKTLFRIHGGKGLLLSHKNDDDEAWQDYSLSSMQHMVLFLCLQNYSYSEIAVLMSEFGYDINPVRVNDYLEQLK